LNLCPKAQLAAQMESTEIQDTHARQFFIRLLAKRRDYILRQLSLKFPEKKERLESIKGYALQHEFIEPRVQELREVEF
jgi:hypothetical protein